jgi:predicted metal-dependent hydrolase
MPSGNAHHVLEYGTSTIEYELVYVPRKTLAIDVHPDLRVTVKAPEGSEFALVEQKVRKRAAWIIRQQRDFARYSFELPPRQYVSGETHRYLGRQYRLKVIQSATSKEIVKMYRGRLLVYVRALDDRGRVKPLVEAWYRKQAKRVFAERLAECYPRVERFGIEYPEFTVRRMKSRWGSCTASRRIMLNLKLIQMPKDCIAYVITHELCHLVEPNHSPAFYALLDRVMPDWRDRRLKLNVFVSNDTSP